MTRIRLLLGVAVTAALAAMVAATFLPNPAQAAPSRSGRIIGGAAWSWPVFGYEPKTVDDLGECDRMADCAAWLRSGCDPALAGRNPAVTTSIVDIADMADGRTRRRIQAGFDISWSWGVFMLQFWSADCKELRGSRYSGYYRDRSPVVPRGAKWMTVSATNDNANVTWSFR